MPKCLAFLAAVFAVTPVLVPAAESAPQPLDELDEVVITGTNLGDRILALENNFYQLYNELNKDDQYDMFCTQIPVRRNDPEMVRAGLETEEQRRLLRLLGCNEMQGFLHKPSATGC